MLPMVFPVLFHKEIEPPDTINKPVRTMLPKCPKGFFIFTKDTGGHSMEIVKMSTSRKNHDFIRGKIKGRTFHFY